MIDTDDVKKRRYEILREGDPCEVCLIKPICGQLNYDKKLNFNYAQTLELARLMFIENTRRMHK